MWANFLRNNKRNGKHEVIVFRLEIESIVKIN